MGAILQCACAAPSMNQAQRPNRKMIEQRVPIAMLGRDTAWDSPFMR